MATINIGYDFIYLFNVVKNLHNGSIGSILMQIGLIYNFFLYPSSWSISCVIWIIAFTFEHKLNMIITKLAHFNKGKYINFVIIKFVINIVKN